MRSGPRADRSPDRRPVAAYIVGTSYCGSTLLGNALNALPGVAYVGEVSRLPAFGVGEAEATCWLCLARGRDCPVWSQDTIGTLGQVGASAALRELARRTGSPTIVDGSKDVRWLWASAADNPDARVIHLIRSPFGFVDTCRQVHQYPAWAAANIWRDTVADAMRSINRLSVPAMLVRYEDLALEPEPVLTKVAAFLNVGFDTAALRFWETPVHAIGGNPGGYAWYPGFVEWHRDLVMRLVAGSTTTEEIPHALRPFLLGDRPSTAAGAGEFSDTVRSYARRQFGGWVDDKWRRNLDADALAEIISTPMLSELAGLAGYRLVSLLSDGSSPGSGGAPAQR